MLRKVKKKGRTGGPYHSYHGDVRIPFISPYAEVSLGEGGYMDSGCPVHVILGGPEKYETERREEKNN